MTEPILRGTRPLPLTPLYKYRSAHSTIETLDVPYVVVPEGLSRSHLPNYLSPEQLSHETMSVEVVVTRYQDAALGVRHYQVSLVRGIPEDLSLLQAMAIRRVIFASLTPYYGLETAQQPIPTLTNCVPAEAISLHFRASPALAATPAPSANGAKPAAGPRGPCQHCGGTITDRRDDLGPRCANCGRKEGSEP